MTAELAADTPSRLVLSPFRGLRFTGAADQAAVISPPYDMIDHDQAQRLADGDAHNIVRVILPELDEPDPRLRYRRAARTLRRWRDEGLMRLDGRPALYVYEQSVPDRADAPAMVQRGLIGALRLPPEGAAGPVHPHEDVVDAVVQDRRSLMYALGANPEPILLTYQGDGAASAVVERTAEEEAPLVEATGADGVRHRLWAVDDAEQLAAVAGDLAGREALIADGHHRYAAYRQLAALGRPGSQYGLALLVNTERHPLRVRGIHRWLPDLPAAQAVRDAGKWFTVTKVEGGYRAALEALEAIGPERVAMAVVAGHDAWLLTDPDPRLLAEHVPRDRPEAWRRLDTTVLHHALAVGVWAIPDTALSIRYDHDARSAVTEAYRHAGIAVLLRPVAEATVHELAAAGVKLPRKSTSFSPKPATGLVLRLLDEES